MKKNVNRLALFVFSLAIIFIFNTNVAGQLLINEIEADPGDQTNDSCQYVELRGTPGSTIAANTYFVAIDSDSAFPGRFHAVIPLGGVTVGSNGLLYLFNTTGNLVCGTRTPAAATTVVNYSSPIRIGGGNILVGSESFAIIQTTATIAAGGDGDANDDGVLDFAVTYIDAAAFLIDPDQQFTYPSNTAVLGTPFQDVPDAFTRFPNNSTPFSSAAYYFGEVGASPVQSTAYEAPLSANFPSGGALTPGAPNVPQLLPALFDFDGDGRSDLSVFRSGTWYINRSSNSQLLGVQWGATGDRVAPDDYDGDGKTDIAVWRAGAPTQAVFYIIQSSNGAARTEIFGQTGDQPNVTGDWDGDGKADVAVYRNGASAGQQSFFYYRGSNNNPNGNITYVPFGVNGDKPVRGDFDGDRKQDAAVFRTSDNSWHILQSSNNQYRVIPSFGSSADKPVAADYDGDGKTDLAVFRPANAFWYILRSSDNAVRYQPFGTASDALVPADYDGDGRADIAVFRDGTWIILNSSNSNVSFVQFGLAGDVAVPSAYIL